MYEVRHDCLRSDSTRRPDSMRLGQIRSNQARWDQLYKARPITGVFGEYRATLFWLWFFFMFNKVTMHIESYYTENTGVFVEPCFGTKKYLKLNIDKTSCSVNNILILYFLAWHAYAVKQPKIRISYDQRARLTLVLHCIILANVMGEQSHMLMHWRARANPIVASEIKLTRHVMKSIKNALDTNMQSIYTNSVT